MDLDWVLLGLKVEKITRNRFSDFKFSYSNTKTIMYICAFLTAIPAWSLIFFDFFSCQFTFLILIWTFISGIWTFLSFLYLSFMSPDIFEFSCPLFIWTYLSMDSSRNLWLLLFRILITSPYYFLCYWFIFLVSYIFYCILFCSFHSFFFQSKFFQVIILTKNGGAQSELIYQVIWPYL